MSTVRRKMYDARETSARFLKQKYFDSVLCASYYEKYMRNAILNFKFHAVTYLAPTFCAYSAFKAERGFPLCVCGHHHVRSARQSTSCKKRGYNQSELVAREASKSLSGEFISNLLFKVKDVPPLSKNDGGKKAQSG
ncbi:MAG: hypothetical protein L6V93_22485 [Clostridiales bacterium]|nr:MAG: hypothetical protein L6V93_22485 [Clostridiales bacterium]